MRNMSFSLTTEQMRKRMKTQTGRLNWDFLQVGCVVMSVEKGRGLRKGERVNRLYPIRITRKWRAPVKSIDQAGCMREGFPDMTPDQFVAMFCAHNKCSPARVINWFQFEEVVV